MNKKIAFLLFAMLGLGVNPVFAKACETSSKHAKVPKDIVGKYYGEARKKLIGEGWQPLQTIHHNEVGGQSGNTKIFWDRGYNEVEACTGTGLSNCSFNFSDIYGNTLNVGTIGELFDEPSSSNEVNDAVVEGVFLECRDD